MYTLVPPLPATLPERKVVFVGLRGVPDIQGGVETHVAAISTRLAERGWRVEVLGRAPYLRSRRPYVWKGVTVTPVWSPRSRSFEALLHTMLGLFVAARDNADLVHVHAIGPALLTPLARLLGLHVVVTHHGFDYERQKWGPVARSILRTGEAMGMLFSHANIGVSKAIVDAVRRKFSVSATFIPNGVEKPLAELGTAYLDRIQVRPRHYILCVGRIVEEKRHLDLIEAFARLADPDLKLVIAGAANLVRTEGDFAGSVYPVLEAIEEQVTLLKLFREMELDQFGVSARIGRENDEVLRETAVVTSAYRVGADRSAKLGVLGPTRMDYSNNMAAVRAVARYVSRLLGED